MSRSVDISPAASSLIESMRGIGYSPETALADLIDNSVAAGARTVMVDAQWNDGNPVVAVLDDGSGMDTPELTEALRLGGSGLGMPRSPLDLGRFGFGLKTASLSQCRCVTVISRKEGRTTALALDLDVIARSGWIAVRPEPLPDHPYLQCLSAEEHGTVVLWTRLDSLSGLHGLDRDTFFLRLQDIRSHLGMVFHRFISGDARRIVVSINDRPVRAWDPFLTDHPSRTALPLQRMSYLGSQVDLKPYVLPHRDRFANDTEYETAGGPGGWNARQGFYVYRGKRLLVAGSWLGLGGTRTWTRDESSKLARISIDLPTDMDREWRIDVRKSQARPPGALRSRLTDIASRCRDQARQVFAWRGQTTRARSDGTSHRSIWLARSVPSGTSYRLDRQHPLISSILSRDAADTENLNALLGLIERTVPVERIWLDLTEAGGVGVAIEPDDEDDFVSQLVTLAKLLPGSLSTEDRAESVLRSLPGQTVAVRTKLIKGLEGDA